MIYATRTRKGGESSWWRVHFNVPAGTRPNIAVRINSGSSNRMPSWRRQRTAKRFPARAAPPPPPPNPNGTVAEITACSSNNNAGNNPNPPTSSRTQLNGNYDICEVTPSTSPMDTMTGPSYFTGSHGFQTSTPVKSNDGRFPSYLPSSSEKTPPPSKVDVARALFRSRSEERREQRGTAEMRQTCQRLQNEKMQLEEQLRKVKVELDQANNILQSEALNRTLQQSIQSAESTAAEGAKQEVMLLKGFFVKEMAAQNEAIFRNHNFLVKEMKLMREQFQHGLVSVLGRFQKLETSQQELRTRVENLAQAWNNGSSNNDQAKPLFSPMSVDDVSGNSVRSGGMFPSSENESLPRPRKRARQQHERHGMSSFFPGSSNLPRRIRRIHTH